jgi:hypothetical protein
MDMPLAQQNQRPRLDLWKTTSFNTRYCGKAEANPINLTYSADAAFLQQGMTDSD